MAQFFAATTRCRRRGAEIGSSFAAHKAKTKPQPYGHGFCFVVNDGGRNCGLRFSITVNIMPLFATLHLLLRKKMMCSPAYIHRKAVTAYRQSLLFMG